MNKDERKLVKDFEKKHLFKVYPGLYCYEYPDTGRAAPKKKPPDKLYLWNSFVFLIEYKVAGGKVEKHQIEDLLKAESQGAFSFIATFYPGESIVFQEIKTGECLILEYDNNEYTNIDILFYRLGRLVHGN